MLATCGAAAEVPKKFGKLRVVRAPGDRAVISECPVPAIVNPRKVSLPPSGPTKSGFCRITGVARRLPVSSNRIGSPPADEKSSSVGVVAPHEVVFGKNTAPTAAAPAALGWPCSVPLLLAKFVILLPAPSSSITTLMRPGVVPLTKPTSIFKVSCELLACRIGRIVDDHDLHGILAHRAGTAAGRGLKVAVVDDVIAAGAA